MCEPDEDGGVSVGIQTSRINTPLPSITQQDQHKEKESSTYEEDLLNYHTPDTQHRRPSDSCSAKSGKRHGASSRVSVELVRIPTSGKHTPAGGLSTESRIASLYNQGHPGTGSISQPLRIPSVNDLSSAQQLHRISRSRQNVTSSSVESLHLALTVKKAKGSVHSIQSTADSRHLPTPVSRSPSPTHHPGSSILSSDLINSTTELKSLINSSRRHSNTNNDLTSSGVHSSRNSCGKYKGITSSIGYNPNITEMSAKGVNAGTVVTLNVSSPVPIARIRQDAPLNRGMRRFHSVAEINAMRNKHVSFDQHRLNQRKEAKGNMLKSSSNAKLSKSTMQLSIGGGDSNGERHSRKSGSPLSISGKGPNSDFTRSSMKSGDFENRTPEVGLTRSKTYAGMFGKNSMTSHSNKDVEEDPDATMDLYQIKGNSLQKETLPPNPNTPQPQEDTDRTKSPILSRYINGNSPLGDSKLPGVAALGLDHTLVNNIGIKSIPRRFKPRKDNSKLVLKYYSGASPRRNLDGGIHFNPDSSHLFHNGDISSNKLIQNNQTAQVSDNQKKVSFKGDSDVSTATATMPTPHPPPPPYQSSYSIDTKYNHHFTKTTINPVSLTTRNLELFDQLSKSLTSRPGAPHPVSATSLISLGGDSGVNKERDMKQRVSNWVHELHKSMEPTEEEVFVARRQVKDLEENKLFSRMYKHPQPVVPY